MKTVRPKPLGAALSSLPLTPEEGFVLSRIDGRLSVPDLVALTGIEAPRVEQIVTKLASHGAVTLEGVEPASGYLPDPGSSPRLAPPEIAGQEETSLADFAAALGMDPSEVEGGSARAAAVERPVDETRVESRSGYPPPATSDAPPPGEGDDGTDVSEASGTSDAGADDAGGDDDTGDDDAGSAAQEHDYRQLYEARFHPLPTDARVHLASSAQGADLLALCFDADPRVVASILDNATCGLSHVRLIAFHHRNGTGLEMLSRRSAYLRDAQTERRLLRNPQAGDTVLGRIFASKRLFQTYKIAIDREVPELTRAKGRGFMRQKFQSSPPEDRSDLIIRTEGRCLVMMTGCTFDAKTTSLLCARAYNSVLFIQNLAKFSATPPALLAHLMKQPFVRKNVPLRRLLLQHTNMPGDVKRQG